MSRSEQLASIRVLVVEDEFLVAMDAEDMLRSFGFENIRIESRVKPALTAVETGDFDLVLLDMNLNGQRSDAVARALGARNIPFIVTTGYQLSEADLEAFGLPPYVRKPYGAAQLHRSVLSALSPFWAAPAPAEAGTAADRG